MVPVLKVIVGTIEISVAVVTGETVPLKRGKNGPEPAVEADVYVGMSGQTPWVCSRQDFGNLLIRVLSKGELEWKLPGNC